MRLRPMQDSDAEAVLTLNAESVHVLSPLDQAGLDWMREHAHRVDVVEAPSGQVAGFVVIFGGDVDYDSPNYRWFRERYGGEFRYLDRVAVGAAWRRTGVGSLIYDAVEADARAQGRMALEVNAEPPNEASLAFHAARGYREVGRLRIDDHKVNAMLIKELRAADLPHGN